MWFESTLLAVIFALCESAFIDTLGKCSVKDNDCQKRVYTESLQSIAKTGIPENDIPPFDPYEIKNVSVSILNLVNITMVDGVAKNMKNCFFNSINTTIENLHSTMEITCDVVVIKGHYTVSAGGPVVDRLLGGAEDLSVKGDGIGKIKIEKLHIIFDFDIFLRESDGEIYIDCKYEDTHYKYDFGRITFAANNLFIGKQEVSKMIVQLLNDNWKVIMTAFGKPFMDTAMDIVYVLTHKFFDVTPTKYYLLEDLREYIKN